MKESDSGGEDDDEGGGEVDVERDRCVLMVMRGVNQRREWSEKRVMKMMVDDDGDDRWGMGEWRWEGELK